MPPVPHSQGLEPDEPKRNTILAARLGTELDTYERLLERIADESADTEEETPTRADFHMAALTITCTLDELVILAESCGFGGIIPGDLTTDKWEKYTKSVADLTKEMFVGYDDTTSNMMYDLGKSLMAVAFDAKPKDQKTTETAKEGLKIVKSRFESLRAMKSDNKAMNYAAESLRSACKTYMLFHDSVYIDACDAWEGRRLWNLAHSEIMHVFHVVPNIRPIVEEEGGDMEEGAPSPV